MSDAQQVSLRHYIETLMDQYQKHHGREHELLAENVENARATLEARLESMNEFRAQILSERGMMVPRETFETRIEGVENANVAMHESMRSRIVQLETAVSAMKGRTAALAASLTVGLIVFELVLRFLVK